MDPSDPQQRRPATRAAVRCVRGVGPERGGRAENQDNYLICTQGMARFLDEDREYSAPTEGDSVILAVCDGMGGHRHGRLASGVAVRVLAKLHRAGAPRDPTRTLLKYLLDAHHQLHWQARSVGPVTMGTTVTVCWIVDQHVSWAHVGDSRLYLLRDGALVQLTTDHTRNEFARRDGRPMTPDGDRLCQTFIYGSRGIADNTTIRLELGRDANSEELQPGDTLLLCTDGLTSVVDDATLARHLAHPDPQAAADDLLCEALARGSLDNVTVLVARVDAAVPTASDAEWPDERDDTLLF